MLLTQHTDATGPASKVLSASGRGLPVQRLFYAPPGAWSVPGEKEGDAGYRIRVASDRAARERAYALAYEVYRGKGFVEPNARGLCVAEYDARPGTFTLLGEDLEGRAAGTVSLAFDSPDGLPCDELYADELAALRSRDRRLVEVTRLAIGDAHTGSRPLLVSLFGFISIFARRVRRATDFVIEVNPRHVNFYRRLLSFETIGPERPCPRVNGAPAVLLRLDLSRQESEIRRLGGTRSPAAGRNLYAYFASLADEEPVAEFLALHHRPMTDQEMAHFGLKRTPETAARRLPEFVAVETAARASEPVAMPPAYEMTANC